MPIQAVCATLKDEHVLDRAFEAVRETVKHLIKNGHNSKLQSGGGCQ